MRKLISVEGHPALVKDTSNGAVINTNHEAVRAAKARKQAKEKQQQLHERVDRMEQDVADIKSMLQQLVNNNG